MAESAYEAWLKKDREWIGTYCSSTRRKGLTQVVPLTLLLASLVFGGLAVLEGGAGELTAGIAGGLMLGALLGAFYMIGLAICLRPDLYVRKLERSVCELSMNEMERELLGREMLAALESGEGVLPYRMVGPHSRGTPARVILTPHYILQEGSSPYAVLVRLSDIAEIRTGAERKTAVTYGGRSKTYHRFTLSTIGFYRRDRFDRGLSESDLPDSAMGFFQKKLRDDVVKLMKDNGLRVTVSEW